MSARRPATKADSERANCKAERCLSPKSWAPRCRATRADNFRHRIACIRLGDRTLYVLCSESQAQLLCFGGCLEHSKATGAGPSCFPLIALKAQQNLRPRAASSNPERAPVTHGLGVRPPAKSCPPAHRKHDAARSLRLLLAMLMRVSWSSSPLSTRLCCRRTIRGAQRSGHERDSVDIFCGKVQEIREEIAESWLGRTVCLRF